MGRLRLDVGATPLASEHRRLLATALRRGDTAPEPPPGERVDASAHPPEAIARALGTWARRAVHEHASAAVFSRLLPQLMEAEAPLELQTVVLRTSMDELRHAALCAAVVERLGGEPTFDADLATTPLPEHAGCAPIERALRNVTFACCLCETVSVGLLSAEKEETTEPRIRAVVEQLASDEILHARFGWTYLALAWPALDDLQRARFVEWLRRGFARLERDMLASMPLAPPGEDRAIALAAARLGVLDAREARELLRDTLETVILPRLEEHGVSARRAWRERTSMAR
ncbi:MAG: diiron oxygenase [Sandaracinaceae bacterium]|nr:diiron oxygenase [Sandaracinaceae bacterium]